MRRGPSKRPFSVAQHGPRPWSPWIRACGAPSYRPAAVLRNSPLLVSRRPAPRAGSVPRGRSEGAGNPRSSGLREAFTSSGRIMSPAAPRPRVAAPPPGRTIGNYRRLPRLAPWRTRSAAPEPGLPRPIRFSACSQTPRARRDGGAGAGPFLAPFRSTPGPQPTPVRCGQQGPMEPSGTTSSFESALHTAVRPASRAEQRSK